VLHESAGRWIVEIPINNMAENPYLIEKSYTEKKEENSTEPIPERFYHVLLISF